MKDLKHIIILPLAFILLLFQQCAMNSNMMFKSPKGKHASKDSIPMFPLDDYRISVDDKMTFTLSTNNGTAMIESMSGIGGDGGGGGSVEYIVRRTGNVELPILGEVKISGLTVSQCEDTLQKLFSKEYQEPFIQVKITSQRVIVFSGNGSNASVIPLAYSNTTLMEVIAQAGGIAERGKANTVKIMRKENGERKIYTLDLSTIEGLKYADMVVQANDYIYVEPNTELAKELIQAAAPIFSIFSSAMFIITLFNTK